MSVQPLVEFRNLPENTPLESIEIPELVKNRRCTNKFSLLIFITATALLIPLLIIALLYGDANRVIGYDQCGNVCGRKNVRYNEWNCSGQDFTDFPYLQIDATQKVANGLSREEFYKIPRKCVDSCEPDYYGFSSIIGRVYSKFKDSKFFSDCKNLSGVGFITLYVFEMYPAVCIYFTIPTVLLICVFSFPSIWYLYKNYYKFIYGSNNGTVMEEYIFIIVLAIFFLLVFVVVLILTLVFFKRIKLVILLLYEAINAIWIMPALIAVPVIIFIIQCIMISCFIYTTLTISYAGNLKPIIATDEGPMFLYYETNVYVVFTLVMNTWIFFWWYQFVKDLQYVIIAGAISEWYWSPNKEKMLKPIWNSFKILWRHLGSVAVGSLVITFFGIFRLILSAIQNASIKSIDFFTQFIKYLTMEAYIVVAMHGQPFLTSGKRATMILFNNFMNIVAIKFISGFVTFVIKFWIIMASVLMGILFFMGTDPNYSAFAYFIVVLVAGIVAFMIFGIYDTVIDTLFICFCEDTLINDGESRPYAMSPGLIGFIEKSSPIWRRSPPPS